MLDLFLLIFNSFAYALGCGVILGLGTLFIEKLIEQKYFSSDQN